MFNTFAYTTIDMIQTGKKMLVDHAVKHERLAKVLNDFVDAQTAYTKAAVNAGLDSLTRIYGLAVQKDFGKELMEAYDIPTFTSKAKSKAASKKAE